MKPASIANQTSQTLTAIGRIVGHRIQLALKIVLITAALVFLPFSPLQAQTRITATITVTNSPYPTNGNTLTVNGTVLTWVNAVPTAGQIEDDPTLGGCGTNLFNAIAANGFSGPVYLAQTATNVITLTAQINQPLTVTILTNWGNVTFYTQSVGIGHPVIVPLSSEPQLTNATALANGIISGVNAYATGVFTSNVVPTDLTGTFRGAHTGNGAGLTNLAYVRGTNGTAANLSITDASGGTYAALTLNQTGLSTGGFTFGYDAFGNAYIDPGTNASGGLLNIGYGVGGAYQFSIDRISGSISFGSGTVITGNGSGLTSIPAPALVGIVPSASLKGVSIQSATNSGTNYWTGDLSYSPASVSSLANGGNADIATSTNVVIRLSGPTGAFYIAGLAGGRNGRILTLMNTTGYSMSISNNSGFESVATNRVLCGNGSGYTSTNNPGFIQLMYDGSAQCWDVVSCN